MKLLKDLGMKYPTTNSKQKKRFGIYQCACGNTIKCQVANVKSGNTVYCEECGSQQHGWSKTKLYYVFMSMHNRCENPTVSRYDRYGGRGISVHPEWSKFKAFKEWALLDGYQEGLSIDRIDNNGNYEPSNCRWADASTQATNTVLLPKNNTSGFRGVYRENNKWRAIIMTGGSRVNIGTYASAAEAAYHRDLYIKEHGISNMLNHND